MRYLIVLLVAGCNEGPLYQPQAPTAPTNPSNPPSTDPPPVSADCDGQASAVVTVAHADILTWMVGTWELCRGDGMFLSHRAVEFTGDGNWWFLNVAADGSLQRSNEFGDSGSYFLNTDTSWEDNNVYIHFNNGNGGSFYPSFKDQPRQLHTGGDGGFESTYSLFR